MITSDIAYNVSQYLQFGSDEYIEELENLYTPDVIISCISTIQLLMENNVIVAMDRNFSRRMKTLINHFTENNAIII
jgi:hypothetical protein